MGYNYADKFRTKGNSVKFRNMKKYVLSIASFAGNRTRIDPPTNHVGLKTNWEVYHHRDWFEGPIGGPSYTLWYLTTVVFKEFQGREGETLIGSRDADRCLTLRRFLYAWSLYRVSWPGLIYERWMRIWCVPLVDNFMRAFDNLMRAFSS